MHESRVDIVDQVTGEVVDHCTGPTLAGGCPHAVHGAPMPCAGHRIVPLGGGPADWQRWVSPSVQWCPLAHPADED